MTKKDMQKKIAMQVVDHLVDEDLDVGCLDEDELQELNNEIESIVSAVLDEAEGE